MCAFDFRKEIRNLPTVDIDNRLASRKLTEHMLGRGYRRIAYIIGPSYLPTSTPTPA